MRELESPAMWSNQELLQILNKERVYLEEIVNKLYKLNETLDDLAMLFELALAEEDNSAIKDIADELLLILQGVEKLEFERMFAGKMDKASAFLDIQSGSGG